MKLENILIEATSSAETFGDINKEGLDFSCSEESLLNKKYYFTIYKTDKDLSKQDKIGKIEMTYMDVWMAEEIGYEIYELFDLLDSEKEGVCGYLFDVDGYPNEEYVGLERDVLYIDKIFIEKKYRKLGIGSKIVKESPKLIRQILKLRPGCIVLLANPFEMEGNDLNASKDKKEIENLIKFYTKNGFERIENTQYLVRNMDYKY